MIALELTVESIETRYLEGQTLEDIWKSVDGDIYWDELVDQLNKVNGDYISLGMNQKDLEFLWDKIDDKSLEVNRGDFTAELARRHFEAMFPNITGG